jgi:hypothetical protein
MTSEENIRLAVQKNGGGHNKGWRRSIVKALIRGCAQSPVDCDQLGILG